jgi:iron(III) transport system substrate-binding protein
MTLPVVRLLIAAVMRRLSPNERFSLAFMTFLLSREGQELASRQGFLPADPAVAPPAGFPDPRSIRVMPLDAARAAREQEEILRRFAQLAGG